jgi:uncharacterized protein
MESSSFVISVHDLDEGGRGFKFRVPLAWLRETLKGCEMQPAGQDGEVEVQVSKTGEDVLVRGAVRVDLAVPCARCLCPVPVQPAAELTLLLEPVSAALPKRKAPGSARAERKKPRADEPEFEPEDAGWDTYEGERVVLDRFVREAILLDAPIFPLCSETCEGIRPTQAQESPATAEPRLAHLFELAKKRTTKE